MIVTAWNNGEWHKTGAGYGVKIRCEDRDKFFKKTWASIILTFEGSRTQVRVNVAKKSFWSPSCHELINKEIGMWLQSNRMASWHQGQPPKLWLEPLSEGEFLLRRITSQDGTQFRS